MIEDMGPCRNIFQSTHPLRGATCDCGKTRVVLAKFQSTHPLRGATHSIAYLYECLEFQSTHPLRGATDGR